MTLNQKYKMSGSDLSFKDWVELQKNIGLVYNEKPITYESSSEELNENFSVDYKGISGKQILIGLGILALIGGGIWAYKKYSK
jgi:hypothetical protein